MERVLVTGGTGFVGTHLFPLLQACGHHIAVLASTGCGELTKVECYEADIRDSAAVRSAIHDFKPNHIYHLAAISSVELSSKSPRLTYEVNVFGTLNVLEAAMSLPSLPRVLNVSTAQVYAPSTSPLSESSSLGPDNPYAASKAMAEFLRVHFRRCSTGGIITARSFNHAGPGQSADFVLSSIAKQFAEIEAGLREPMLVLGNIHVKRDFTDVRDVVQAYSLLMEKGTANEIYNVCSGRALSISEIIAEFESISGTKVEVESHSSKRRAGEIESVCGNPEKIKAVTGWVPSIPLKTTLQDLLDYWRAAIRDNSRDLPDADERSMSSTHLVSK